MVRSRRTSRNDDYDDDDTNFRPEHREMDRPHEIDRPYENGWRARERDDDRPRITRHKRDFDEDRNGRPSRNGSRTSGGMEPGIGRLPLTAIGDSYAEALQRGAAILSDNVRHFQNETARFINRRAERDLEVIEDLSRSRSLFDVFGAHQRWLSSMARDYSDGLMRMTRLGSGAVRETVSEVERMREH
jgi:hypothetical protein